MKRNISITSDLTAPQSPLPSSVRTFNLIVSGQTRSKPKFLVHPKTGALYRLVLPEGGERPFYEELPLEDDELHHLRLSQRQLKSSAKEVLPALPEGYSIHNFRFNCATPKAWPAIRFSELHSIINGLGRPYRWSMTEYSDPEAQKQPMIVHLLYHHDRIVGACAWNRLGIRRKDKTISGGVYLLDENERGKGLGHYLLVYKHQQMLDFGVEGVIVSTSGSCTDRHQQDMTNFYRNHGYKHQETLPFSYENFKATEEAEFSIVFPERHFRHPQTGEELPRFQQDRREAHLERTSRQLLARAAPSHSR